MKDNTPHRPPEGWTEKNYLEYANAEKKSDGEPWTTENFEARLKMGADKKNPAQQEQKREPPTIQIERAQKVEELSRQELIAWARKIGKESPEQWVDEMVTIDTRGSVTVNGNLDLSLNLDVEQLPIIIRKITGNLNLAHTTRKSLREIRHIEITGKLILDESQKVMIEAAQKYFGQNKVEVIP